MSGVVYTLLSLAASLHCSVRPDINPCTCRQEEYASPVINSVQPIAATANANNNAANGGSGVGGGGGGGGGHHWERIEVWCEKMKSFNSVSVALKSKFTPEQQIILRVTHSSLRDISQHDFKELNMSITRLYLNHDNLG